MTSPVRYQAVPSNFKIEQNMDLSKSRKQAEVLEVDVRSGNPKDGCCTAMHRPIFFLMVFSSASFIQGMVTDGLINTGITSIERRFQLSSTQSGIIVSIYFFTGIFVNLIVSYIGGRGHKARWLAGGMVFIAIGAMVYSLPHFLSGHYQYTVSDEHASLCEAEDTEVTGRPHSNTTDDPSNVGDISNYLYFFAVAQVALGCGAAPLYTLGIAYLDENVSVHRSGLYLGIFYAAATLGPATGYITGGLFLKFYTDFQKSSEVTITAEDPSWVGAWWLGMVIASPLALCTAGVLSLFPRELPGTQELRKRKISVAHKNSGVNILSARPDFGAKPMDFFIALKLLLRNPTMMFLNGVGVFESMMVMGFAAYLPKLMETQFGQTASFSATVVGVTLILGGSGGSIVGGWLVKRFKWDIKANITFSIACTMGVVLLMVTMLLRCPSEKIVGTSNSEDFLVFLNNCTSRCYCSTQQYTPVCTLDDEFEFFSPCHAGCSQHIEDNIFGSCTCVQSPFLVKNGKCKSEKCNQLKVYILGLFLGILTIFLPLIPSLHASLRCVPESQRSFSLGLSNVVSKIFGSFPAPILFGTIIDSSCIVWQMDTEGESRGSCWLYDTSKLAWRILLLNECLVFSMICCYTMSLYFYKPVVLEETETKRKDHANL